MSHNKWINAFSGLLVLIMACGSLPVMAEDAPELSNKIEKVEFSTMPDGRVAIRIQTAKPLTNIPPGFTLTNPSRIALDFANTANGLTKSNLPADQGALKSVSLAQAKERTRMVLTLSKAVGYSTTTNGNETTIILQANEINAEKTAEVTRFAEVKAGDVQHSLRNIDFTRGKNGEGRILVDLSDAAAGIDIRQQGKTVVVDFINTDIPANLQRRLNVINFNTPVLYVDAMKQGKNSRLIIEPQGNWEQSAYQTDKKFIIDIRPIIEDPNKLVQGSKTGYAGEKLSLNFQNIDVRSVLQVIADFTGLNIITSDSVTGNLTLRLKDVPWDQALDIIMQSKGLTQRKTGNVVLIAPLDEVTAKEKLQLEANQQIEDLEALRTEVFTLKYQKADNFKTILTDDKQRILSKRGSAVIDPRTNTLFVQDTAKHLEDIQRIINKIDIPVKQVMIESRLVIADEKFGRTLGAKLGIKQANTGSDGGYGISSTSTNAQAIATGASVTGSQDLNVNLPVSSAFGSLGFSLFRLPANFLLNLELSALETDKRGKVISSPRVTTANQQKALIEQGVQIPYITPASAASTTPAVAFKSAVLSLAVTPQITPDDKVIMDLEVKKDRVGQIFSGVPSIDTQRVQTQVLVSNGETAVLGGIFEQTERNDVEKVPFFGNLPVLGNLFKRTTRQNDKTELLIFITPKILDENLNVR
ncbi:secretin [Methylovorus sp. MM2]|uniref:type IV pilus secretin PilQ n=1 Tax=Methylovorus sp. MM2 TaxID=1848038 RepID=UPI0007E25506|nr:type IV pilus secretin PilQ [Methylovorus sp. MM2]OAM52182.1 secretin [Methylovorus sp. MM2]